MWSTPAPPFTAWVAASIWSGTGEVNTAPGQAASSMPRPTNPPCMGSWPIGRWQCAARPSSSLLGRCHKVVRDGPHDTADDGPDDIDPVLVPRARSVEERAHQDWPETARGVERRVGDGAQRHDDRHDHQADHEPGPAGGSAWIHRDTVDAEDENRRPDRLGGHRLPPGGVRAVAGHAVDSTGDDALAEPEHERQGGPGGADELRGDVSDGRLAP